MLCIGERHGADILIIHNSTGTPLMLRMWEDLLTRKIIGEIVTEGDDFGFHDIKTDSLGESKFCLIHKKSQQIMIIYAKQDTISLGRHDIVFDDDTSNFRILRKKMWSYLMRDEFKDVMPSSERHSQKA